MRIMILTVLLMLLPPHNQQEPDLAWVVTVHEMNNYDFNGMEFFQLRRGAEAPLVTVPQQSELASFLRQSNNKKVIVTFTRSPQ